MIQTEYFENLCDVEAILSAYELSIADLQIEIDCPINKSLIFKSCNF